MIELGDWLYELYPPARNLYLYREAESWIKSNMSAFISNVEDTPEGRRQYEIETRGWMKLLIPSIARYNADQHLSFTELSTLMWLDNVGRYLELHEAGIEMLAIPYPNWKLDPRRTAVSMLDYCGVCPDDLTAIEEILTQDSQAGSAVSQDALKKKTSNVQYFDPAEMSRHLQNHASINTPDFDVPNTLKL